jgi:Protein of unknown function (DUF3489)
MLHSNKSSKSESTRSQTRGKAPKKIQRVTASTRGGTKQDAVLGMLRQPKGATIAAIMNATGWQKHSVRGFLAGVVRKRLKLKLGSQTVDGNRVYQVTGGGARKAIENRRSDNRAASVPCRV